MEMLRIGGRVITPVFPPAFQERAEMGSDVRGTAAALRKPNKCWQQQKLEYSNQHGHTFTYGLIKLWETFFFLKSKTAGSYLHRLLSFSSCFHRIYEH